MRRGARGRRSFGSGVLTGLITVTMSANAWAQSSPSPAPECFEPIDRTVLTCPDLTFGAVPAVAFLNDNRTLGVSVTVENIGDAPSDPTMVLVASEGWPDATTPIPALEPKALQVAEVVVPVPEGVQGETVTLDVSVDPDGSVPERDENNDFASLGVEVPAFVIKTTSSTTPTSAPTTTIATTTASTAPPVTTEPGRSRGALWWIIGATLLVLVLAMLLTVRRPKRARRKRRPESRPTARPERHSPVRAARVVSTGFASVSDPSRPLDPDMTLGVSTSLYYWFEAGPPVPDSIELTPRDLPTQGIPAEAELEVILSPLGRGEGIEVATAEGTLALLRSGKVIVRTQPSPGASDLDPELRERRMLFGIRTPAAPGTYRLRCGIYHRQTLIQSRLVTAEVTTSPRRSGSVLRSEVDYTLSARIDPALLADISSHTLSIMVNRSDDDTHDLLFVGDGFRTRVALDALALQQLVTIARGGLRKAAWGDDQEWTLGKPYLYGATSLDRLRTDIVQLAKRGMALYATVVAGLSGGREAIERLERDLLHPGSLQIALGRSARLIPPASLVYDYRGLETELPLNRYELCEAFVQSLDRGESMEETACFTSACPSRGEKVVVCPSGFWGFRHEIGFPVSEEGREASPTLGYLTTPTITVAVSLDPNLVERTDHERAMHQLWGRGPWNYASSRQGALEALRDVQAQVIYLYCHGGVTPIGEPFVQVGPTSDPGITATVLLNEDVFWEETRPLVFINGCHTTAVEPEKAFELVSPLVATSGAAGVIGTEITIFEPLARSFAESYFRRFVAGQSLGAAVRGARLELLAARNPLGLAYIPFALPGLRLHRTNGPQSELRVEQVG